jgi:hypothetical protein
MQESVLHISAIFCFLEAPFKANDKVTENQAVSGDIVKEVAIADISISDIAGSNADGNFSSGDLFKLSEQLNHIVAKFKS